MSSQLISLNPDLKKLYDEGYELEINSGLLIVRKVPYVNSKQEILCADLVSVLDETVGKIEKPKDHLVYFTGEYPCDKDGLRLTKIVAGEGKKTLLENCVVQYIFSSKPVGGYTNYYDKMTAYINIISNEAKAINPKVDARNSASTILDDGSSIFNYADTALVRFGILEAAKKFKDQKIAIIGVGGTGSYILDLVVKTFVKEIHLYDSDEYLTHNVFRSPGAPSEEELKKKYKKVKYFEKVYSKMRKGIISHEYDIDCNNIDELKDMDFVFISIDGGNGKELIFQKLEEFNIPFIDVGMGVFFVEEESSLGGVLTVTTSTDCMRDHVKDRVSFSGEGEGNDEYSQNIQIADLNAYNAVLAVIKWKKISGFYLDYEKEHFSVYTIDGNIISNEEKLC